jgi:hypothetical protein
MVQLRTLAADVGFKSFLYSFTETRSETAGRSSISIFMPTFLKKISET